MGGGERKRDRHTEIDRQTKIQGEKIERQRGRQSKIDRE